MPVFSNKQELYEAMCSIWNHIGSDGLMSAPLVQSRLIVRFSFRNPDGQLTVDASDGKRLKVVPDECEVRPDIEMSMNSDLAHKIWSGEQSVPLALLQGKIRSRGQINKALALLPVIRPAFQVYPGMVESLKKSA